MRLGLRLPILPTETLPSFVSHCAQKNGSRHVQDFVEDMGLNWRRILQLDPDTVSELALLTDTDAATLAAYSFEPVGDGSFHFLDCILPRSFLDRSSLKFCPMCAASERCSHGRTWGRALWQIDALQVCPDHGVILEALDLPKYPRCPHDFAGRVADHRVRISQETFIEAGCAATQFASYLSARLHGHRHSERHSWLDTLPIDVAARLCENIGTLIHGGPKAHPRTLTRKNLIEAGALGFATCLRGPDAIRDVYESVRLGSPGTRGGFYSDFGFYTRWLQRVTQPKRYLPIVEHFRDFVLNSYPLAPGQEVLGQACSQRRWFTWADIGKKYNLTTGRMARFQSALGIRGDDLRRVAPGRHDTELEILSTGLDRTRASRRLHVHPSAVDKLIEAGLLRYAVAMPHMDKLFRPKDIDSFLTSIFAHSQTIDEVLPDVFPLRVIAHKATLPNTEILRAVIDGGLKKIWRKRDIDGLPALHLNLTEVLDVFEAAPLIGLRREDVRTQLHINGSTVCLLLRKGMIASTEVRDPRTRQYLSMVAPAELDRFLSLYLPLGLMAYELGRQAKHVAARLDRAEVRPIQLPDHCSKIYLRTEAAPIIAI